MVYEMNKSFVTKVLIMSTVLMAGILVIPTNIHDAKANPCSDITAADTGGNGGPGGNTGPAGTGGNGGERNHRIVLVEMVEILELLVMPETLDLPELQ